MSSQTFQPPTDSLSEEIRSCWRHLPDKGLFFGLLAIWLLLFHFLGNSSFGYIPTKSLFFWMSSAYQETEISDDGHGLLIPFLVLGIIWWKREELLSQPFRTWWPGLLLVGLGLLAHIAGYVVQQQRLSIVGLFVGIYGLTGLVWGPRWLLATFFPFFLFSFMVPLGSLTSNVTFPLQRTVTWIVEHLFNDIFGIGVVRAGTQLFDPMGTYKYDVAPACGGMRSLISIFLISISYGFLVFRSPWKRFVMIAASLPLAVIGNTVRLSTIVAAGVWKGQSAGEFVHDNGLINMLPYIPAIMGVMLLGRFLEKSEPPPPVPPPLAATAKSS
jgi:exosortase